MEITSTSKEDDRANHYTFTKVYLQPAYLADWILHSK
jgi:hypothetical protein